MALKSELKRQIKDEYMFSHALRVLFLDDKNYSTKLFGYKKCLDSANIFFKFKFNATAKNMSLFCYHVASSVALWVLLFASQTDSLKVGYCFHIQDVMISKASVNRVCHKMQSPIFLYIHI